MIKGISNLFRQRKKETIKDRVILSMRKKTVMNCNEDNDKEHVVNSKIDKEEKN